MITQRTHYVTTTTDGVTIGGTEHGQGPPLVFVHGMMADGDIDWQVLLPHLTGRFTCYLPSYRGRGPSCDHPDLSPGRMVDDIIAHVDSIEAPTGRVGWSSGAYLAVTVAAAQSDAPTARSSRPDPPSTPACTTTRSTPDPAHFGMPAEDDGSRDDPLLSDRSWAVSGYRPDVAALAAAPHSPFSHPDP